MRIDSKPARYFALGVVCGAVIPMALVLFPSGLIDRFYDRQIEAKAIAVWERQASGYSYEDCRAMSSTCLGKIVEWPVSRLGDGVSFWGGKQSQLIRWRNPAQVPKVGGSMGTLTAVARVVGLDPDAVVLVYIGTPQAIYSGSTWKEKFGSEKKKDESFTF